MTVHVEYTAQLRVKTGRPTQAFELVDGATVQDLLNAIAEQHDIQEFLAGSLLCFIGSSQAEPPQHLSDNDRVTLLTPISGG